MRGEYTFRFRTVFAALLFIFFSTLVLPGVPNAQYPDFSVEELAGQIGRLMKEGDIPGLGLVIVRGPGDVLVKSYGYADVEQKKPVTADTLFELASCSKAFTALAALQLEKNGAIRLDDPVSRYLPWFYAVYEGKEQPITLRQLLHHTSGIPWRSIDLIPASDAPNALDLMVRRVAGIELNHLPGSRFEYASMNYDVLGLVIEKVSGMGYEDYMKQEVFRPLGLHSTFAGPLAVEDKTAMARGYRIGFFKPRKYDAPIYRGNTPAGYIVASARDMGLWLKWHLGLMETTGDLYRLIEKSHRRDRSVPPNPQNFSSYCMGWQVYLDGGSLIDHGGRNPNFTSYMAFDPKERLGVVVLANSDSSYTPAIGRYVLDFVKGEAAELPHVAGNNLDKTASVITVIFAFSLLCTLLFLLSILLDVAKGRRRFEGIGPAKVGKFLALLGFLIPLLLGIYFVPHAMSNVSWDTAMVWSPVSFQAAVVLLAAVIGLSYPGFVVSSLFPHRNKYTRSLPTVLILSLLAGVANAVIIFLITGALFSHIKLGYQLYYFSLAAAIYILGRKVLQTRLVRITYDIVYDLRLNLINKIFLTSYQRFEKMDRGRVYATLNDDTTEIGNAANVLVQLVTSGVTALGAFIYLAAIAFWATVVTLGVVAAIAALYSIVSQRARACFEDARDTMNVYMRLLNGMLDGFKELSLQINKKREYRDDLEKSCREYRQKIGDAIVKFVNAFLIGESMLIVVLGAVGFGIPRLFPDISIYTLVSFIMVLLYLIGPITGILVSIPRLVRLRVSWNRLRGFEKDIPVNLDPGILEEYQPRPRIVENIQAKGLEFEYKSDNTEERFKVGPLDFEARRGEITFIIGGNGSGKTTLARLLTGLYRPDAGEIKITGSDLDNGRLGECFSTVFSDYHLFARLYNVDLKGRENMAQEYLEILRLEDKVNLKDSGFSTIDLSGGQRKRLALLQCYLEDSPIYLFDEIAADQDPEFRKFFYRDLLLKMKKKGKIVIAITHDDHYFNMADKIIKMDMGKIERVDATYRTT